jgi:hypothetical protein
MDYVQRLLLVILSVSVVLTLLGGGGDAWWLTSFYGPSRDMNKPAFMVELHEL